MYISADMPHAILLLLLPSLVHLPLLNCTFIILNIQYFWIHKIYSPLHLVFFFYLYYVYIHYVYHAILNIYIYILFFPIHI